MNSLKPRPPFQVLTMSEESRLGRERLEVGYALKQIISAGVEVWFYLEDRRRTLDTPVDKIMLSLTAFADELEREKARQRTYDAMQPKARAGHVTGGRVFGYDNVEILSADGKRSHVERRINEPEAAVVRRIFELSAAGVGYARIAKTLNGAGALSPRPQQARPAGWAPSIVQEILRRPLYRGEIVWNRTRKRDQWGRHRQSPRHTDEWMRLEVPALRIVAEPLWHASRERLSGVKNRLMAASGGRIGQRSRDIDSHYLLPGFSRCGVCAGAMGALSRSHGGARAFFYGCVANHKRGKSVCDNATVVRMDHVDAAVLAAFGGDVLRPEILEAVIEGVFAALDEGVSQEDERRLRRELAAVEQEAARLTAAVAAGGQLEALVTALRERQVRATDLSARLATATQALRKPNRRELERRVRRKLEDWRRLLTRHVQDGRQLFREVLRGPIRFLARRRRTRVQIRGNRGPRAGVCGCCGCCNFGGVRNGSARCVRTRNRRNVRVAALRHGS
jgi:DNA invertase Pin-like site-specific DNA recombinase